MGKPDRKRQRQYGDSTGIDWNSALVVQCIEDYLSKKIRSLEMLCWRIFEITGVSVSKMTMSRRLNGKSYVNFPVSFHKFITFFNFY